MTRLQFGGAIKMHMFLHNISQIHVALKSGVNKSFLSLFLNERYIPTDLELKKICTALNLSFEDAKKGILTIKHKKIKEKQQSFAF